MLIGKFTLDKFIKGATGEDCAECPTRERCPARMLAEATLECGVEDGTYTKTTNDNGEAEYEVVKTNLLDEGTRKAGEIMSKLTFGHYVELAKDHGMTPHQIVEAKEMSSHALAQELAVGWDSFLSDYQKAETDDQMEKVANNHGHLWAAKALNAITDGDFAEEVAKAMMSMDAKGIFVID